MNGCSKPRRGPLDHPGDTVRVVLVLDVPAGSAVPAVRARKAVVSSGLPLPRSGPTARTSLPCSLLSRVQVGDRDADSGFDLADRDHRRPRQRWSRGAVPGTGRGHEFGCVYPIFVTGGDPPTR